MAGNTSPIFPLRPINSIDATETNTSPMGVLLTTGTNTYDGTAGVVAFTFDAAEGGEIPLLRFKARGANVATVARVYINNGGAAGTAGNNSLITEVDLPITVASATVSTPDINAVLGIRANAGDRILVHLATTVAAGWQVTPINGVRF
jgi:hypothetical protein